MSLPTPTLGVEKIELTDADFAYLREHRFSIPEAEALEGFSESRSFPRAKERAKEAKRKPEFSHIPLAELYALLHYTYDGRSKVLNSQLIAGTIEPDQYQVAKLISSALNRMPALVEFQGTVYRGLNLKEDKMDYYRQQVGKVIRERGFVSTLSRDFIYSAEDRPYLGHSTIFKIESLRGIKTFPTGGMWGDEVLFRAGTRFRVVSADFGKSPIWDQRPDKEGFPRKFVVHLQELPDRPCQRLTEGETQCCFRTVGMKVYDSPKRIFGACCELKCGHIVDELCRCANGEAIAPHVRGQICAPD